MAMKTTKITLEPGGIDSSAMVFSKFSQARGPSAGLLPFSNLPIRLRAVEEARKEVAIQKAEVQLNCAQRYEGTGSAQRLYQSESLVLV